MKCCEFINVLLKRQIVPHSNPGGGRPVGGTTRVMVYLRDLSGESMELLPSGFMRLERTDQLDALG
jgi:hypothetical protein